MIQKVAFTPQPVVTPIKDVNFTGSEIIEEKKDNSALLYGSLAVLGALGLGLVLHKPKVVEKEIAKTVEKTTEQVQQTASKKTKSKTRARKNLNITDKHMNKADAKWQRKRNKQIINEQIQREESFTEQELQAYAKENGYKKPTPKQQKDIDNLHTQNAEQRAQTNTIENLAKQQEPKQTKSPVENPELKGIEGTINNLKKRIAGAKRFGKDTSKLEAQLNSLMEKRNNIAQNVERKN